MGAMESYGVHKIVDNLGRITIPKEFREALRMDVGDEVVICHVDDGILIKSTKGGEKNEG